MKYPHIHIPVEIYGMNHDIKVTLDSGGSIAEIISVYNREARVTNDYNIFGNLKPMIRKETEKAFAEFKGY